jgi:hypothetical protein
MRQRKETAYLKMGAFVQLGPGGPPYARRKTCPEDDSRVPSRQEIASVTRSGLTGAGLGIGL